MASRADLAAQQQAQQTALARAVQADVAALWAAYFDPTDVAGSWPQLQRLVTTLIRDRRRTSSGLGSAFYRELRGISAAQGDFTPITVPDIPIEQVTSATDSTAQAGFLDRIAAGAEQDEAAQKAGTALEGAATRLVLGGGRDTIKASHDADDGAIGWQRLTDEDPCYFCAMLGSRGPVYKSAASAGAAANARFTGDGAFKYHDHDQCTAVPIFSYDDERVGIADKLADEWATGSAGHSGDAAIRAFRRYWDAKRTQGADS